jgi:hypothetical protein
VGSDAENQTQYLALQYSKETAQEGTRKMRFNFEMLTN